MPNVMGAPVHSKPAVQSGLPERQMTEIARLLDAARESRLVIFAGAGVSMGAPTHLPDWRSVNRIVVRSLAAVAARSLGESLANKAADLILARHAQEKLPPEYQAQVLSEFLGQHYFKVLCLLDSDRPNPAHLAVAWLARLGCVRAVITTNFDRVMEHAFRTVGASLECCFQPEHFRALAADLPRLERRGVCHLLKLHGSVDDSTTLIDTLAQRKKGFAAPVLDCVRHLLRSSHWLFLGFSGLDLEAEPNYLTLAQEAERAAGFTWFVRENTEPRPSVLRLQKLYGERGGLVKGDLPAWLLDFADRVSPEPRIWLDDATRRAKPVDEHATLRELENGAAAWAESLPPHFSALALTQVVQACAEPQTAAQLAENVLRSIEKQQSASADATTRHSTLKSCAANSLGALLAGLGRHEEAVRWLTHAVSLAEANDDADSRDRFRCNLAHSLETLGRLAEAHAMYRDALAGFRAEGDPAALAAGLTALASHLIRMFRLEEARVLAEEAVQWAVKAGDERLRGTALNDLGIIAKLQQKYPEALKIFAEVEELFARLGNDEAVAAAAGNRGEVLAALGQFDEAERIQRAVLQVSKRLERRDNEGANCLGLGLLAQLRGDLAGAQDWFNKAREVFRTLKDPGNEAVTLRRLASVHTQAGRFEEAVALAESALPLVSERHVWLISDLWNQIGMAEFKRGYVVRAEQAYRKVYALTGEPGVERPHAAAAMNIGTSLLLQQRDEEAARYFDEAGQIWTRVGDAANGAHCQLGTAAVRLDQRIAVLSETGHAARDPEQARAAAREMLTLYPELIAMYEEFGATPLVAEFCSSAASTAKFVGELDKAARWYRRAADVFHSIGRADRARESLDRSQEMLRIWTNALIEHEEFARALPDVLLLADVAEQLGHGEMRASALLNAAIIVIRTSQDYARAKALAERSLALLPADSSDVVSAQRVISQCNDADHDRTRLAQAGVDEVTAVAPNSLQWIQHRGGNVHTLLLSNGKIVVLGFTTNEVAFRVLGLIVKRFPGDYLIAQAEGVPRALFEQGAIADGGRAEDYWFVYEGTEDFTKLIASLEAHQPPTA